MKPKKKAATVRMLVAVPRLQELTLAEQRRSIRDDLMRTGDYYGRRISVQSMPCAAATAKAVELVCWWAECSGGSCDPEQLKAAAALVRAACGAKEDQRGS